MKRTPLLKVETMKENDLFFVYGTLMSSFQGGPAIFLRKNARFLGDATCAGYLYRVSWYPGLVLSPHGRVHGELYQINSTSQSLFWPTLDEYEGVDNLSTLCGEEYCRKLIEIEMDGRKREAWTYVYVGEVKGQPIADGRFLPK